MMTHLTLPRKLMITGSNPAQKEVFIKKCMHHFERGIKLVQLRAKELSEKEYRALAKQLITAAKGYDALVILNCELSWTQGLDASGLHLSSTQLMQASQRPVPNHLLLSAACHNKEQVLHAQAIGVDLLTLSPVQSTKTHPQAKPLGWNLFATLCQSVSLPVYALGGMKDDDLETACSYGAYGIAAIRSLWDSI